MNPGVSAVAGIPKNMPQVFPGRDQPEGKDVISTVEQIMTFPETTSLILGFTRTTRAALTFYSMVRTGAAVVLGVVVTVLYRGSAEGLYNILWAVVFGFATLNILSLAARRFEPERRGLTFGELMAVVVVLIALFLLGWEMLNLFHIFPIKLRR